MKEAQIQGYLVGETVSASRAAAR